MGPNIRIVCGGHERIAKLGTGPISIGSVGATVVVPDPSLAVWAQPHGDGLRLSDGHGRASIHHDGRASADVVVPMNQWVRVGSTDLFAYVPDAVTPTDQVRGSAANVGFNVYGAQKIELRSNWLLDMALGPPKASGFRARLSALGLMFFALAGSTTIYGEPLISDEMLILGPGLFFLAIWVLIFGRRFDPATRRESRWWMIGATTCVASGIALGLRAMSF